MFTFNVLWFCLSVFRPIIQSGPFRKQIPPQDLGRALLKTARGVQLDRMRTGFGRFLHTGTNRILGSGGSSRKWKEDSKMG
ncbi:hypothetical protein L596_014519 [Steinernema carpocapsae]|uniref:Secreted protein n=1 Tax=Steinernema carpocapsae TaxID=34508 RepID=A0A4V6A2U5_STECR|nr:hypothetical protein L596_014519 [Steinernema carpocapsae]